MADENEIIRAKAVADAIRNLLPDKAAEIDKAVLEAQSGQRESLKIDVSIKYRLEKFDGDYEPGMTPIEIIEGDG